MIHPLEERCYELVKRGLDGNLAHELRWAGDETLVSELEAASDSDLQALNTEWARRRP